MKSMLTAALAAIVYLCLGLVSRAQQNNLTVPNKTVQNNGVYLFQRLNFEANNAASPNGFSAMVTGTATKSIRRVMLIDRSNGRIVASTSWLYNLEEGNVIELAGQEAILGSREYGLYAHLNGNLAGTVSVRLDGWGYRSEKSVNTNQGNAAMHTLEWNSAGYIYADATEDIDLKAKVGAMETFGSFVVTSFGGPTTKRFEFTFTVDGKKGRPIDLRSIALVDANGKKVARTIRTLTDDNKRETIAFELLSGVDISGTHTFLIKGRASKRLNGCKVAFFLDCQKTIVANHVGARLLLNDCTDLIPLQTIEVGSTPNCYPYYPTYPDYDGFTPPYDWGFYTDYTVDYGKG